MAINVIHNAERVTGLSISHQEFKVRSSRHAQTLEESVFIFTQVLLSSPKLLIKL